ncbi:MAG: signal peptidase I [Phycisphaerae bacterium]|nr:signal peptidase I [Phycisphaerae bacterium]
MRTTVKRRFQLKACAGNLWRGWLRPLLPVLVVLLTLRSSVADWNVVPSGSMQPTILIGDRVSVNKLAYGLRVPFTDAWIAQWGGPERGEIAVLTSPEDGTRLIKRVIGLPGDVIEMRSNRLLVNGQPVVYSPLDPDIFDEIDWRDCLRPRFAVERMGERAHPIMLTPDVPAPRSFGPVTVPDGHYFVMGDNRDRSKDSRVFGFVPRDNLIGRSSRVIMSLDYDDCYLPRWDRFFSALP